ncbi:MAG: NTP transferase domain-containing protein [Patescibacteria group bacterium]
MSKLTGVILAAGMGTRLGEKTTDIPKALVKVCGQTLVSYAINFLKEIGVDKIIVVGGFCFGELVKEVKSIDTEIEICETPDYKLGNLYSLEKTLENVNESFFLWHVDHIFPKSDVSRIRDLFQEKIIAVCDDGKGRSLDDEMKIKTSEDGKVLKKVSKKLLDYSRAYIGITYCPKIYLGEYKKALKKAKIKYGKEAKTEGVMQIIADENITDVYIGDISEHKWFEIDYPKELEMAEKEISKNKDLYL